MSIVVNRLKKPQAEIFRSKKRFIVVCAGRRFGKSYVSGAFSMDTLCNHSNKTVVYVAPTQTMARNIMWDNWIKKHIPSEYISRKNEQLMVMNFINGSVFYCLSAENPDRLRGLAADLLIVDECASIGEDFLEIVRPILSDKYHDGRALYISTPDGYNWFYKLFKKGAEDPENYDAFQFTTLDGGNVSEEEVAAAKRDMSPRMFRQEYLATFESMSSRIYENFNGAYNNCEKKDYWGDIEIHVGIDFNVNPMTAVISVWEGNNLYIFDEIVEPNSNTTLLARTIRNKYPEADVYVYPDPTGNKHQTNAVAGVTDFLILKKAGFVVCAPKRPYATKDKFNTVNTALRSADGQSRVFVAKGTCPHLREAWSAYAYRADGDPDKSNGFDHISDAAAYLICYKLPFKKVSKIRRPKVFGF